MLSKLLKYEWKACARACLPIYGAILVVALINRIFEAVGINNVLGGMPQILAAMVYFGVMVAVFVVTLVILIQRFYKSLLGDEGYLMFTLPVTVGQHIWAKSIIAFVMSVLSGIAALLSVVILSADGEILHDIGMFFRDFFHIFTESDFGVLNTVFYFIEVVVLLLLLSFGSILFVYVCIALGHLAKKHRVAMAVIWYFVLTTVMQFLFGIVMLSADNAVLNGLFGWVNHLPEAAALHVGLLMLCVCAAIPAAAFYGGTRYILKNKLNLE